MCCLGSEGNDVVVVFKVVVGLVNTVGAVVPNSTDVE